MATKIIQSRLPSYAYNIKSIKKIAYYKAFDKTVSLTAIFTKVKGIFEFLSYRNTLPHFSKLSKTVSKIILAQLGLELEWGGGC